VSTVLTPPDAAARPRPSMGARLVGLLGELLLTLGVLTALFAVWQLWWTDVVASGQQEEAVATIRETFEADGHSVPDDTTQADGMPSPSTSPPPRMAPPGTTEIFGIVYVPRWGEDYAVPIAEGVDVSTVFNQGNIGHYPGTAMPGEVGNFATAAHRQSYGAPYRRVEDLQAGDPIIVETAAGWFAYRVTKDYVVTPDQVDVIAAVPGQLDAEPTERLITLTTCHPLYSAAQRWITHGEFTEWYPRTGGPPTQLMQVP